MPEENKAPSFILKSWKNEILPYWLKPHVNNNILTGYVLLFYSLKNSRLPKKGYQLWNDNKVKIVMYLLW